MNTKNLIGGLLAGTALGVAIGLLMAPSAGSVTISKLKKGSKKLSGAVKHSVDDSLDSLLEKYNNGVDSVAKRIKA